MKKQKSMKLFTVLRYLSLGAILGYMAAEAIIHGFINRFAEVPAFHALCPFEAFGTFLNTLTGLEFFSNPFASASVFFLFLILLAILLNRVFCGFLCAFGALQEFMGNLGAKVMKKRFTIPKKADRVLRALKYVFLVLSVLLAYFTGYEFFRNFLGLAQGSDAFSYIDPWIAFKSLLSNNLIVGGYIASLVILVISLVGSFFFNRFYCRYVCPLGGLYAVFGSLSGLHVFRNVKPETVDLPESAEGEEPAGCDGNCAACALEHNFDAITEEVEDTESASELIEAQADNADEAEEPADETPAVTDGQEEKPNEGIDPEADGIPYEHNDEEFADEDFENYDEYEDEDEELIEEDGERDESGDYYCINCGKCSEVCPMGIDVAGTAGNIDFAECISCQRCVAACPKKGALQTRYFKAKSHPIIILLITFLVFFGGVFALNFIKIDRGGPEKEPIYDSIRLAPEAPSDGSFSVSILMEAYDLTFEELKDKYSLSDSVTEDASYTEFSNGITLKYFKENSIDDYNDIILFFGLSDDVSLDTSMGEILGDAPIRVSMEYLGFDPEYADDFAAYFGASADDKFSTISAKYNELYEEYYTISNMSSDEWNSYIAQYGHWYQCSYGAKSTAIKNTYELATECKYETDLAQYLSDGKFTVQWMLQQDGSTLEQFKATYHLDDSVTLRSPYSVFFNAIKLSYYKEAYAADAEKGEEDLFPGLIAVYGYTPETIDLNMTIGTLLDSGTIDQAARFFGCTTDEEIESFCQEYGGSSVDAPFSEIHSAYNKAMDEYYDMIYQYYNSMSY